MVGANKRNLLKKKGSQPLFKELSSRLAHASVGSGHGGLAKSKEEAYHMDSSTTGGLKAPAWCGRTVGAQQLMEDLGWRLGSCDYCGLDLAAILEKPQEWRKVKPSPPLPMESRKTSRTLSVGLKSTGGFPPPLFFFFPSLFFSFLFLCSFLFLTPLPPNPNETIRLGAVKAPETDPKREHKANPNN